MKYMIELYDDKVLEIQASAVNQLPDGTINFYEKIADEQFELVLSVSSGNWKYFRKAE